MEKRQELQQSLKDLQKMTGLDLKVEAKGEENLEELIQGIQSLCFAYRNAYNKDMVIRRWLLGEMSDDDFFPLADRMHISREAARGIFLISLKNESYPEILTLLRQIFPDDESRILLQGKNQMIVFYHFPNRKNADMKKVAYEILDTLNTELLEQAAISFGGMTCHLDQLPASYQKAEFAMKVGKVFYPDRIIYDYDGLGVGNLLYGLSEASCREYIRSTLGKEFLNQESPIFQSDILQTANCFLKNDLNIAETSRQLHIHRNTLLYRLEQIQNDTGLDIRRFDAAMTYKLCSMILLYLRQR